jgi:hypothetical protein
MPKGRLRLDRAGVVGYSKIKRNDYGSWFWMSVTTFRKVWLVLGCAFLLLSGCSSNQPAGDSPAVQTLENYLKALADKNETAYSQLICPDWEMDAFLEFDAYQGVQTSLSSLTCRQTGEQNGFTLVTCQGKLSLSYQSEQQVVDLSRRSYRLALKNGTWQVCGFTTTDQ